MSSALAEVIEPRSITQIMSELLQATVDGQWSDETNMECHCHPVYVRCCPSCGALEHKDSRNNEKKRKAGEHEAGCTLYTLIEEARAYLRAENTLAEERGEDTVWIP
jgi:hypothetical protein